MRRFFRRVDVDYASHSPGMDVLIEPLQAALAGLRPRPATTSMYSTVRARAVDGGELDPTYWSDNLREPVRFESAIECVSPTSGERHDKTLAGRVHCRVCVEK